MEGADKKDMPMENAYRTFLKLYEKTPDTLKANEKRFDIACEEFKKAEVLSAPSAALLVKKGRSILLSSEACPYSLEDAEQAFKHAIKEDENHIEAYIELAYYYLNVQDDPRKAKPYFERALTHVNMFAGELVAGIALCVKEMESPQSALEYLRNSDKLLLNNAAIKRTKHDIETLVVEE